MIINKAIKTALFIASTAIFVSIPSALAHAEEFTSAEQGVAGMSLLLDNVTRDELEKAYVAIQTLKEEEEKPVSPYEHLGVSKANSYVNIRKEPSIDSEIVGKLYRGCATDILEYLEEDWVKIKSGDVEGYIDSKYLAIGEAAEAMVDEYATKYATVTTRTLFVREEQSTESKILTMIPLDETYVVIKEHEEWAEILLGTDDDTGGDFTGYVSKQYIDITVKFNYAISIEEENRIKREQEEAERAERERKEKLAQEEAERKEAARKEAERKAEENAKKEQESKKDKETKEDEGPSDNIDTSSKASLREEVVDYALKFVGNPYVWGGTSLTKGADCSGFVYSIYGGFGYKLERVSKDQAKTAGKKVSESEILPGDLIFYANSRGTVNHVAIYIGNGKIVHAANKRQGIIVSHYKYRDIYCVRRVIY